VPTTRLFRVSQSCVLIL